MFVFYISNARDIYKSTEKKWTSKFSCVTIVSLRDVCIYILCVFFFVWWCWCERGKCSYLVASLVLNVQHDLADRVLGLLRIVYVLALKVNNVLPVLDNLLGSEDDVNGEAVTGSTLPAGTASPTAADFVEAARGVGALVAAESEDERGNVVGLEGLDELLGHDGGGHGGTGVGSNGVDVDAVLETLEGQSTGESEDTAFLCHS